jgi:type IV pilus assembly protein PilQ
MCRRCTYLLMLFFLLIVLSIQVQAQTQDRITALQERLESLTPTVPGLKEKVQLSMSGVTLQEYLNALGRINNLSLSVDPKLNFRVNNNFNDVTVINVLVFLAKNYNLDIQPVGNILMVTPYQDPSLLIKPPVKEITARYDQFNNSLSLELNNDSLLLVARRITQLSGKNVVVPIALQGKRVSIFLSGAPFETALEKLAYANELKMTRTSDNYYLFQPLEENEQVYINGDRNTAVRRNLRPTASNTGGGHTGLNVKTLKNGQQVISADATNASLLDLVKQAAQETGKSYFLYSDIKGTISLHANDMSFDNFMAALFQGTEYTFRQDNGVYLIGDRKLEGLRTSKVVQLQNRSMDTVLAMIPNDWRRGVEIREFREQNTLLLSGSRPQVAEIESFIKQIDVLVPMVLIEVTLLDINKSRNISTGIRAGVGDSTAKTGGSILPGLDFTLSSSSINSFITSAGKAFGMNIGKVTPNFYVGLTALENQNNVEVRSVPKLSTLNGHTASLSIGSERYYTLKTQNVIPSVTSTQSIFTTQFQKTEANLAINIKPLVSGDDQVTLNIDVSISDFIGTPTQDAPPPKSNSKFNTIIRAHNEDMIVLGGIERTAKGVSSGGIPLLSRIPILKYIFSRRSRQDDKIVTVVFIKPTIIR